MGLCSVLIPGGLKTRRGPAVCIPSSAGASSPLLTLGAKITLLHATFAHYSQIIQENRETAETELSGRGHGGRWSLRRLPHFTDADRRVNISLGQPSIPPAARPDQDVAETTPPVGGGGFAMDARGAGRRGGKRRQENGQK